MTEAVTAEQEREALNTGTKDVADSHRFDEASLARWMEANVEGYAGPLEVRQFKGGQSNPTYQLVTPTKKYVLRRKPPGKLLPSAHAVDREYKVISALGPTGFPVARSYGLSGWALYRQVILPGALPSILVGVRFSLGLMWVLLIVAETISAQAGIGYLTMNAREFLQTDLVLVGIGLYAVLGKLADLAAKGLERWWLRWHPGYQSAA